MGWLRLVGLASSGERGGEGGAARSEHEGPVHEVVELRREVAPFSFPARGSGSTSASNEAPAVID